MCFYTGAAGTVELQLGPRTFVRAAPRQPIALDNHEPDFVAAPPHVRPCRARHPRARPRRTRSSSPRRARAFTVERNGYYHVECHDDTTTFRAHRGGLCHGDAGGRRRHTGGRQSAGEVVTGAESRRRGRMGRAPTLTAWDRWNYQRTDYLIQPASTQHVGAAVYGTEDAGPARHLAHRRDLRLCGCPPTVAPGWVPYSTGRWIWDPRFGWTWLDDAPVGLGAVSLWPLGPCPQLLGLGAGARRGTARLLARARRLPGGGVHVGVGAARCTGRRSAGVSPSSRGGDVRASSACAIWHGWGGPRVVNNVVVRNTRS